MITEKLEVNNVLPTKKHCNNERRRTCTTERYFVVLQDCRIDISLLASQEKLSETH